MKRLFFVSLFSFGMLFFVQPQIVSASACTDNRGSCVYNAAGCPSGTSQNNNYACDAGFEGLCCVPTTGDSSDSDSSSGGVDTPCVGDNKVGFSGLGRLSTNQAPVEPCQPQALRSVVS